MLRLSSSGRNPASNRGNASNRMLALSEILDDFQRSNSNLGYSLTGQQWTGGVNNTWSISSLKAKNTPVSGANLLTNGGFDSDTSGWTASGATLASVAGGATGNALQVTNSGAAAGYAYQAVITVIGQWYRVDLQYKNGTAANGTLKVGNSPNSSDFYNSISVSSAGSWGGRTLYFCATATITYMSLVVGSSVSGQTTLFDTATFAKLTTAELFATLDSGRADVQASVVYTNAQRANAGLAISVDSATDPQNFVLAVVAISDSKAYLIKCVNGVYTILINGVTIRNISAGSLIELKKIGNSYTMLVSGWQVGTSQTINDASIINNTLHGMFGLDNQGTFVNFRIAGCNRGKVRVADPENFGANTHAQTTTFPLLKAGNMGWARCDFNWSSIEPTTKGTFNWTTYDAIVAAANAAGVQLAPNLSYSPQWANGNAGDQYRGPLNPQDYADFCAAVVARYAPQGVKVYELWNEPNLDHFWLPAPDAVAYANMIKPAYIAMKAIDPSITVSFGGITLTTLTEDSTNHISANIFLQRVYDTIGSGYFDVFNLHPYDWPWAVIYACRNIMVAQGDGAKKIWFGEVGRPSNGTTGQDFVNEEQQAAIMVRAIKNARSLPYAGPLLFYEFQESSTVQPDREGYYGITRSNGTVKPAYIAIKQTIANG